MVLAEVRYETRTAEKRWNASKLGYSIAQPGIREDVKRAARQSERERTQIAVPGYVLARGFRGETSSDGGFADAGVRVLAQDAAELCASVHARLEPPKGSLRRWMREIGLFRFGPILATHPSEDCVDDAPDYLTLSDVCEEACLPGAMPETKQRECIS